MTNGLQKCLLVLLVLALSSLTAFSQGASTGSIAGTVLDPKGAVVAGATVTVRSVATNQESTTQSSGDGTFSVPALAAGVSRSNSRNSKDPGISRVKPRAAAERAFAHHSAPMPVLRTMYSSCNGEKKSGSGTSVIPARCAARSAPTQAGELSASRPTGPAHFRPPSAASAAATPSSSFHVVDRIAGEPEPSTPAPGAIHWGSGIRIPTGRREHSCVPRGARSPGECWPLRPKAGWHSRFPN